MIELDPNIKFPKGENESNERRKIKKRQTEEKVPVASEKAAKTLLGTWPTSRNFRGSSLKWMVQKVLKWTVLRASTGQSKLWLT